MDSVLMVAGFLATAAIVLVGVGISKITRRRSTWGSPTVQDQRRRRYATEERVKQEHYGEWTGK